MTPINEWAQKHNISEEAVIDLQAALEAVVPQLKSTGNKSETVVQQRIRLAACRRGIRLWRNNVGACSDENGNHVRYGLANDSGPMNSRLKSHDLIGITPVKIETGHVGSTVGIFTSVECKKEGWTYQGTPREQAQKRWAELIIALGGYAHFATCPEDIWGDCNG